MYSVSTIDEAAAWVEHDRHWDHAARVLGYREGLSDRERDSFANYVLVQDGGFLHDMLDGWREAMAEGSWSA